MQSQEAEADSCSGVRYGPQSKRRGLTEGANAHQTTSGSFGEACETLEGLPIKGGGASMHPYKVLEGNEHAKERP